VGLPAQADPDRFGIGSATGADGIGFRDAAQEKFCLDISKFASLTFQNYSRVCVGGGSKASGSAKRFLKKEQRRQRPVFSYLIAWGLV
jgi:hypothetical protein